MKTMNHVNCFLFQSVSGYPMLHFKIRNVHLLCRNGSNHWIPFTTWWKWQFTSMLGKSWQNSFRLLSAYIHIIIPKKNVNMGRLHYTKHCSIVWQQQNNITSHPIFWQLIKKFFMYHSHLTSTASLVFRLCNGFLHKRGLPVGVGFYKVFR